MKYFVCIMFLVFLTVANLFSNTAACQTRIKEFWKNKNLMDPRLLQSVTSDFTMEVPGSKNGNLQDLRDEITNFHNLRNAAKRYDFGTAYRIYVNILKRTKTAPREIKKNFSDLNGREKEQFKQLCLVFVRFPHDSTRKKINSLKIADLKITGTTAVASITYFQIYRRVSAEITLVRKNRSWLVRKLKYLPPSK